MEDVAENGVFVFDGVESFDTVVVRVEPGEHDVAAGVAIGDADVGMLEAEGFARELVGAGGGVFELASKTAEGIGGHVIDGDD